MRVELLTNPGLSGRLGDVLLSQLRDEKWTVFHAAVAFVKRSGVRCLDAALRNFSRRAEVKISVGVDFGGTSEEGLVQLFDAVGGDGHIWVFHNTNGSTFHPKVFLFRNQDEAFLILGSGNLTKGGLFTNYEAALAVSLDLTAEGDQRLLTLLEQSLDFWTDGAQGICRALDSQFMDELIDAGYLPPEVYASDADDGGLRNPDDDAAQSLFAFLEVPPPPPVAPAIGAPVPAPSNIPQVFLMILQRTDRLFLQAT
jgi:HKD family nuclease